jgi:hypothetical protein
MSVCSCCGREVTEGELNRTKRSIRKHFGDTKGRPHIMRFTPALCTVCARRYLLSLSSPLDDPIEPADSKASQFAKSVA